LIPDEIIRRPKQGFAVPVSEWFERELGERIRSKLTTFCREHAWLDGQEVQKVLDRKNSQLPWYLFNFVLWHETWIEQKDAISALLPATRG
jgi:asparagine synthase (glutamine-hydrolysing)